MAANSERWVTAMLTPSTITSLILYTPLLLTSCQSILRGEVLPALITSVETMTPSPLLRLPRILKVPAPKCFAAHFYWLSNARAHAREGASVNLADKLAYGIQEVRRARRSRRCCRRSRRLSAH